MRFLRSVSIFVLTIYPVIVPAISRGQVAGGGILGQPSEATRKSLQVVSGVFAERHLSQRPLDESTSLRWLQSMLWRIDRNKLYFRQSDVEPFLKRHAELAEKAKVGDMAFAYDLFRIYQQRIDECTRLAKALLMEVHDFSVDEEMVFDHDLATYASDDAAARELWRKRIKYDLLVETFAGTTDEEARRKLSERLDRVADQKKRLTDDNVLEEYLNSLAAAYDPHSAYVLPAKTADLQNEIRGQLDGIGAQLESVDGYVVVNQLIAGGPAFKDGRLRRGDKIVGIGEGAAGDIVDVVNRELTAVVSLIRGKRGTVVKLKVVREGEAAPMLLNITRDTVQMSEIVGTVLERGTKADGKTCKIGWVNVPGFYDSSFSITPNVSAGNRKSCSSDLRNFFESGDFKKASVDVVVLDLRSYTFGLGSEVGNVAGVFARAAAVGQSKGRDGGISSLPGAKQLPAWNGPLVILVSRNTPSVAEVFVGAMQDLSRGLIVGDSATNGRGTVQTIVNLDEQPAKPNSLKLGTLRLTAYQYYRLNGSGIQYLGVQSDVVLPSLTDYLRTGESYLRNALRHDRIQPVVYSPAKPINPELIQAVAEASKSRRAQSQYFQAVGLDSLRLEERNNRRTFPLEESKARDALKPIGTADKTLARDKFELTDYNREVLDVAIDYARLLAEAKATQPQSAPTKDDQRKAEIALNLAKSFAPTYPDKAREYAQKAIDLAPGSAPAKDAEALIKQLK